MEYRAGQAAQNTTPPVGKVGATASGGRVVLGTDKYNISYPNNYNVRSTGKVAEFSKEGKRIGQLFKFNSANGNRLSYTYKYLREDGNILKIENQLVDIDEATGLLSYDLNLEKAKGHGVGSTIFNDAIDYFGDRVRGIAGRWEGSNPNYLSGISDNLVAYREGLTSGLTPTQAALNTPTGRMAQKRGFSRVRFTGDYSINSNVVTPIFE